MKNPLFKFLSVVLFVVAYGTRLGAQSTINVGAVAANTNTGYFLNADGTFSTNGQIVVGYFSKSQSELAAIIAGWDDKVASYDKYSQLASFFTAIGTGSTNYGSSVPGWNFNSSGAVSGTSSGIATNVLASGTQLYIWSFGTTNLTSNGLSSSSQWGLVTSTNWSAPASGTASLQLSNVSSSGVLIGNDLSGTSSANSNSVAMFTQRSVSWTNRAGDSAWNNSSTNWGYAGNGVTFQNGDLVSFGGNASGTITVQPTGVKPGGMIFTLTNSLTVTGGNIDGSANLALNGAGTLTIASVNSFKGGTTLNGGVLVLGNASAIGSGAVTVSSNSLLQPSASITFSNAISIGSGASLTISTPSSVTLAQTGIISGSGGLTKTGAGSLLLSRPETYSGSTLISSGSLSITSSGSLLGTTNVVVGTGGTLLLGGSNQLSQTVAMTLSGGTLQVGDSLAKASATVGSLTLTANSIIDFSSLSGSSFSIGGLLDMGGNSLSIYNWKDGDRLTLSSQNGFIGSLANIRFFTGMTESSLIQLETGFLGDGRDIVPVPEPSVVVAFILCVAVLLLQFIRSRRFVERLEFR